MDGEVRRAEAVVGRGDAPTLTTDWDHPDWAGVEPLRLDWFHPASSDHRPRAAVRLLRNGDAIHLQWRVDDRYVVVRHTGYQDPVCQDSCVEFFVRPRADAGYFNLECNAGGAMLLFYVEDPTRTADGLAKATKVPWELAQGIGIATTLPPTVEPEEPGPVTWGLAARVPLRLFEAYSGPVPAVGGEAWRANFYKCADRSSHPHWAAWSPVGDDLNFHQPDRFGVLRFAER